MGYRACSCSVLTYCLDVFLREFHSQWKLRARGDTIMSTQSLEQLRQALTAATENATTALGVADTMAKTLDDHHKATGKAARKAAREAEQVAKNLRKQLRALRDAARRATGAKEVAEAALVNASVDAGKETAKSEQAGSGQPGEVKVVELQSTPTPATTPGPAAAVVEPQPAVVS